MEFLKETGTLFKRIWMLILEATFEGQGISKTAPEGARIF
jgi:hypothetical protein